MNEMKVPIRRCKVGWEKVLDGLSRVDGLLVSDVVTGMQGAGRHYHDHLHVGGIWATWVGPLGGNPLDVALLLADAFHDIVYDASAPPGWNEEQSAKRLLVRAAAFVNDSMTLRSVSEAVLMILGSKDHLHAGDDIVDTALRRRVRLFCDLDLSGMATDREGFDESTRLIRDEYPHVSDDAFAAGRRAFFETYLAAPKIFRSGLVPDSWEARARENIARALSS